MKYMQWYYQANIFNFNQTFRVHQMKNLELKKKLQRTVELMAKYIYKYIIYPS